MNNDASSHDYCDFPNKFTTDEDQSPVTDHSKQSPKELEVTAESLHPMFQNDLQKHKDAETTSGSSFRRESKELPIKVIKSFGQMKFKKSSTLGAQMKKIPNQKGDFLDPKRYQNKTHKRRSSRSSNSLKASKASKASKGSRNSKRLIQNKKKQRFKEDGKSRNKRKHEQVKVMWKYYSKIWFSHTFSKF